MAKRLRIKIKRTKPTPASKAKWNDVMKRKQKKRVRRI